MKIALDAMGGDICLLYTSDAADDLLCVDLGGRRIIKKKLNNYDADLLNFNTIDLNIHNNIDKEDDILLPRNSFIIFSLPKRIIFNSLFFDLSKASMAPLRVA